MITTKNSAHNTAISPAKQDAEQQKLLNQIYEDVANQKYTTAINLVNSQPSNLKSTFDTESALASIYLDENNNQQALNVYKQIAKKFGLTLATADNAAETAYSNKDYSDALYFYQQAESLAANSNDPMRQNDIDRYNFMIQKIKD